MFRRAFDSVNQIGVNLLEGDQRLACICNAQFLQEESAVAFDGGARVVLCEAEVQGVSAVWARDSAVPGGEGVDEPGQLGQLFRVQELEFGFGDSLGRHDSIILKIWRGAEARIFWARVAARLKLYPDTKLGFFRRL